MSIAYQSKNDKWVKCISSTGTIRAIAVIATETATKMAERQSLSGDGAKALAEAVIASLILSSYCKTGEKVNLNIQSSGWCKQAIIDANSEAEVRGYVLERDPSEVKLARNIGPWGIGLFSVLRTKHEEAQPYIGTVPLLTGHLAKDLTFYWLQSEQVRSAVGIEVFMKDGKITLAEGFLIQAMPGATDEDILLIEEHLKKLHQFEPNSPLRATPVNLLSYLLDNQSFSLLEEKPLTFKCPCSVERVKRSLILIGSDELKSMLNEGKDVDVICDFCAEKYSFSPDKIREIMLEGSHS